MDPSKESTAMPRRRRRTALLMAAALGASAAFSQPPRPRVDPPAGGMAVVLLGTGIPLANPDRSSAATLVLAGEHAILIDTGRDAVVGLAQTGRDDVSLVVFTHYHSDHIAGFGEVLVNRAIAGAAEPLPVIGPTGARAVVDGFRAAYALEDSYRVAHHGEHWSSAGASAAVTEAEPGVVWERDGVKVTMFLVDHAPVVPAVGYRVDFQGKSVVVSGDTKRAETLVEAARGVDLLVHEVVDRRAIEGVLPMMRQGNPRRAAMTEDMMSHHTTTLEVAAIARDAGVKKLALTHLVPSIPPTDAAEANFVRGMSEIYAGPIVVGRDGMVIVVP
jgi:ribonuclease Z